MNRPYLPRSERERLKMLVDKRRRELEGVKDRRTHGTSSAYRTGCKCEKCLSTGRAAHYSTQKRWRQAA